LPIRACCIFNSDESFSFYPKIKERKSFLEIQTGTPLLPATTIEKQKSRRWKEAFALFNSSFSE
jgi:hypothetical protein